MRRTFAQVDGAIVSGVWTGGGRFVLGTDTSDEFTDQLLAQELSRLPGPWFVLCFLRTVTITCVLKHTLLILLKSQLAYSLIMISFFDLIFYYIHNTHFALLETLNYIGLS